VKDYKHSIVKFNNGDGALLCNRCGKIVATGFEHEDREHYCDKCMLKQVPLDAAGKPAPPIEKPHRGRIVAWTRIEVGAQEGIEGTFLDHPSLHGFVSRSSAIVKGPDADGEIETLNSRYVLIGSEATGETIRSAQRVYDSLPVLVADEGLAYAIAERDDFTDAVAVLCAVIDRTLVHVVRTAWERRFVAAMLFEPNWATTREMARRLMDRLVEMPRHRVEVHRQIEAICAAMLPIIAPRRDEDRMPYTVAAVRALNKSARWAVEHGEAKPDRAQILVAAWAMRASGLLDALDRKEDPDDADDCFGSARRIAEGLHRTIGRSERKPEERERTKPDGVIVMPRLGGISVEKHKEIERAYKKVLGVRLPVVRAKDLAGVRARLAGEFPHAVEQIGVLLSDLVEGEEIRFRSTLVTGKPGGGKSRLIRRLCAELKLPLHRYDAAGASDNAFSGTSRRWYSGEHCVPMEAVHRSLKANVGLLIDEIDKASVSRTNGNVEFSLLPFVDGGESAAEYADPFIEAELDLSHVNYFLTANDDSKLQGPLRDRLRIVRMPEPRREDLPILVRAMVADVARERGGNPAWWPPLNEDEIEIAGRLWLGGSVRRLRVIVERLLAAREKNARN
jgi:hypothetical protein